MIDPFSDEADPVRLDGSRPPALERTVEAGGAAGENHNVCEVSGVSYDFRLGRRTVVLALAALPMALGLSGCAHPMPACPTRPADPHHCRHRFCRHYSG